MDKISSNGPGLVTGGQSELRRDLAIPGAALVLVVAFWIWDLHFYWRSQPEYEFGWLVPLLAGFLAWERWPLRGPRDAAESVRRGVVLRVLLGGGLLLFSELYRNGIGRTATSSFAFSCGCYLFASCVVLEAGGKALLRCLGVPLLFMFVAAPIPRIVWGPLVTSLQGGVAFCTVELLGLIGIPAERVGHVIRLPNCVVGVDQACSGIRSLQSTLMAAFFIGILTLRLTGMRVLLVGTGVALAMVGNVVRALLLARAAAHGGPEALARVHDSAGWGILAFTAAGVAGISWGLGRLEASIPSAEAEMSADANSDSEDASANAGKGKEGT